MKNSEHISKDKNVIPFDLHKTRALITGASVGLGREFARQLAPHAQSLFLVARRKERLNQLKVELSASHPKLSIHIATIDLSQLEERVKLLTLLQDKAYIPNLLINNAGIGDHGTFATADWDRVQQMIDVNMTALTHLCHALLPVMQELEAAAILNISSLASQLPLTNMSVYAATKAYVTHFSEALRIELSKTNVSVTAVCPGPVHTEFGTTAKRPSHKEDVVDTPKLLYVSPEKVVSTALQALTYNKPITFPGNIIKLTKTLITFLPMPIIRFFLQRRLDKSLNSLRDPSTNNL